MSTIARSFSITGSESEELAATTKKLGRVLPLVVVEIGPILPMPDEIIRQTVDKVVAEINKNSKPHRSYLAKSGKRKRRRSQ